MQKIYILFVILFSTLLPQEQKNINTIDSLMNSFYKKNYPGAVILAAKEGKIILNKAYGLANVQLNVPNKPEDVFALGSISKQFAAISILQLEEQGRLSINDNLNKYFPEYKIADFNITIKNILSHTSGIVSYTEKENSDEDLVKSISKDELVKKFANDSLLFAPGSDWSYSNSNFVLAARIVEKVSGLNYQEYVKKNILLPLGMENTCFGSNINVIHNMVNGYNLSDTVITQAGYFSWSWILGAGELFSNADDMFKWYNGLCNYKILSKSSLGKAWSPYILSNGLSANYGLGWAVDTCNGIAFISHGGAISGFLSDEIFIPSKNIFVIVLSNCAGLNNPSVVTEKAALLLADTDLKYNPVVMQENDLKKFTGVYEVHRAGSRLAKNLSGNKIYNYITLKNDTLYVQRTGGAKTGLIPLGNNMFKIKSGLLYKFNLKNNEISSLEVFSKPVNYGPNELEPKTNISLPPEKVPVIIDNKILTQYAGKYDFGGDLYIYIKADGNKLILQEEGQPEEEIFAESSNKFYSAKVDLTIEFIKENGKVVSMVINQLRKFTGKKIE